MKSAKLHRQQRHRQSRRQGRERGRGEPCVYRESSGRWRPIGRGQEGRIGHFDRWRRDQELRVRFGCVPEEIRIRAGQAPRTTFRATTNGSCAGPEEAYAGQAT